MPRHSRRTFHKAAALGTAALGAAFGAGCFHAAQDSAATPVLDPADLPMKYPGSNVILVSFDALQAAHVGSWGYPRAVTPTIDEVARQGFAFLRTYSVASWTVPASMTWFTGVYPSQHRMTNKFAVYNERVQQQAKLKERAPHLMTLASALGEQG